MWSKVAKLASPAPRKPSSASPLPPKGEQLVLQLVDSLRLALSSPSSTSRDDRSPSEKVTQLLEELLRALKAEQASGEGAASPLGACAEVLLRDAVLAELVELVQGDEPRGVREGLVRWFGRAIVELDEAWLGHSAVNKPLYVFLPSLFARRSIGANQEVYVDRIKLLKTCVDEEGGLMRQEELAVVEVMCVVAERIKTVRLPSSQDPCSTMLTTSRAAARASRHLFPRETRFSRTKRAILLRPSPHSSHHHLLVFCRRSTTLSDFLARLDKRSVCSFRPLPDVFCRFASTSSRPRFSPLFVPPPLHPPRRSSRRLCKRRSSLPRRRRFRLP